MITEAQHKWLNHLSNDSKIKIVPYDPTCQEKFEKVKVIIQCKLGNIVVLHCGASSLGISGQDEIDIYVPVLEKDFDNLITPLSELFGKPQSHYPLKRARFVTNIEGKHIDVFLINSESSSWLDSVKFEKYLRANPQKLKEYEKLKRSGNGLGTRDYYTRKIEFINRILESI